MAMSFFWRQALRRSTLLDIETTGLDPSRHAPIGAAHARFGQPVQETWFTYETAERVPEGPWYRKFGIKTEEQITELMEPFALREWQQSWEEARRRWIARGGTPAPARKYFSKMMAREARAGRFIWTHNVRFDITQFGSQFAHPAAQRMMWERAAVPGWTKFDPYSGRVFPTQTKTAWQMRSTLYDRPKLAPGAMQAWYGEYRQMVKQAVKTGKPAVLDSLAMAQAMMGMAQQRGAMARTGDIFTGTSIEALAAAFGVKTKGRAHLARTDVETMMKILPKLIETTEALHKGERLKGYQAKALKYLGEIQPKVAERNLERMFAQAVTELEDVGRYRLQKGGYSTNLDDLVGVYKKFYKHRSYYHEGMLEEVMSRMKGLPREELDRILLDKAKIPETLGFGSKVSVLASEFGAKMRRFLAGRNPYLLAGVGALAGLAVGSMVLPNREEHNTVIGLKDEGFRGFVRRLNTDFGSGYQGPKKSQEETKEKEGMGFLGWYLMLSTLPTALMLTRGGLHKGFSTAKRLITGRATLFHGTAKPAAESIMGEGLLRKFAAKEGSISKKVLINQLGFEKEELEGLVYLTEQGYKARTYAAQQHFLDKGFGVKDAGARAGIQAPLGIGGHQEGVVKFSIPTWKKEIAEATRRNPEIAKYSSFQEFYEKTIDKGNPLADIIPEPMLKAASGISYYELAQAKVLAMDVGPEYIVGRNTSILGRARIKNPEYNPLTWGEWTEYASLHPGRVTGGVGVGAATAGLPLGAAYWMFGDEENATAIQGFSEQGVGSQMRKQQSDFGSKYQAVAAVSKWAVRFSEGATAKYLRQSEVRDLMVYLRGQIKNSQLLKVGRSSFGLEMTDAVLQEHITTLRKLEAAKGAKGGVMLLKQEHFMSIPDRTMRIDEIKRSVIHESFHSAVANQPGFKQKMIEGPIPQNLVDILKVEGYGLSGSALEIAETSTERLARLKEEAAAFLTYPEATNIEGVRAGVAHALHEPGIAEYVGEMRKAHQSFITQMPAVQAKAGMQRRIRNRYNMIKDTQKRHAPRIIGVKINDDPHVPGMVQKMYKRRKQSHVQYHR
jgi:DNA polymerase III epsilon subunit-like protein